MQNSDDRLARHFIIKTSQMARRAEELISQAARYANKILPIAKESVVYRASVAYLFQHIRFLVQALQKMKGKEFTSAETEAIEKFIGLLGALYALLPQLGKRYFTSVLNYSSVHIHKSIDQMRQNLIEICGALSIDWNAVHFEKGQDTANKIADLQHLKEVLKAAQSSQITAPNAVDVAQLLEIRIQSIDQHLRTKSHGKMRKQPSSDEIPVQKLQKVIEDALSVFTTIDIPCDQLRLQGTLGSGGFGTVYIGTRLPTAELLAVKQVRSDRLNMATWASLYSEMATMMELKNPYILELVGVHVKEPYRIITRYCPGGSLFDRLHKSSGKHLTPPHLTEIALQVAQGMKFLHENGIVHRDLKTMNILLDENDVAKIADFGLAGVIKAGQGLQGGVGTPHYSAPEVLEKKRYGPKVDIFSYGVILWEMATRKIPYRDKAPQDIYDYVVLQGKRLPYMPGIPAPVFELISRCWSADPNLRPDFSEIVDLFTAHKIQFQGDYVSTLKEEHKSTPLDLPYLLSVLEQPMHTHFESVVRFLVDHIDVPTKEFLQKRGIMANYSVTSEHLSSILLLASVVLREKEFEPFIESFVSVVIGDILSNGSSYDISCALSFCLKVPDTCFDKVKSYTPKFVARIFEPSQGIGALVVRLIARGTDDEVRQYQSDLVKYFDEGGVSSVKDVESIEALTRLFPILTENCSASQIEQFIPLLDLSIHIPNELIQMIVSKIGKDAAARVNVALLKAACKTDVSDILLSSVQSCDSRALENCAQNLEVFDHIHRLIVEKKSINVALLFLFRLAQVSSIPTILVNHPMLHSLLDLGGHAAQKLQIFTCLLASEPFCIETPAMDDILKFLLSSATVPRLSDFVLKMIGALSSHPTGRDLILEAGLLSVFTELFLTTGNPDNSASLTILYNMAQVTTEIPQLSLIVSCLMQDVLNCGPNQCDLLRTITKLLSASPVSVQESDIRQSIVPLLSQRQSPVVIILVLRLLEVCDMNKLAGFYDKIAQRIYRILVIDDMMFPELLVSAIELITSLATAYDMAHFINATGLIPFVENIVGQVTSNEAVHRTINNCLFTLRRMDKKWKSSNEPKEDTTTEKSESLSRSYDYSSSYGSSGDDEESTTE